MRLSPRQHLGRSDRLRKVLLAGSAVGACAAVVLAGAVSAQPSKPPAGSAGNRRAARLDAVAHLDGLNLGSGAAGSSSEPAGGGSWLKPMPRLSATTAAVDVHAWWRVPGGPDSVLADVEAHPPKGSKLDGSGSGGGPSGQTMETVSFGWPPVSGVLGERELSVTVVPLEGDTTGVLAQAESVWIVPRPAGERIPGSAHELDFTSGRLQGPIGISRIVTNAGKVSRIVSLINAMEVVQPGVYSCPSLTLTGAHLLSFTFRARAGGRLLAVASYEAFPGLTDSSGPCNPIRLRIAGRREVSLLGGAFVPRAQRVLGFRLTGRR
jgi:hypothetical protein